MLRLIDVCKSFKFGKNKTLVLDRVNLDFKKNELVFILGKSGSGKSTLLNIIGGLLEVDSGKVLIDDKDITKFSNSMLCNYRNNMIGNIFQDYHLIEYMSVIDNIKLGQTISNNNSDIETVLRKLGIYSKRRVKVNKLSGGEKQRVAIARAIVNNPEIILCDEPTGALDSSNSIKIMDILKELSLNKLVIVVSHDESLAEKYADRIINITDGRVDYIPQGDDKKFRNIDKKKISILSIFKLAIKSLGLKKGRTLFTSLAVSLGFICMLLVLCLSRSFKNDVNRLEEDIVSSFPISVYNGEFPVLDVDIVKSDNKIIRKNKNDYVHTNIINNNYIDYIKGIEEISYIGYEYDLSLPIISDRYIELDNNYLKISPGNDFIDNNYDIVYGKNIESIYDIVLKIDSNNNVSSELLDIFNIDNDIYYEELIGRKLRVVINDDYYVKNGEYYFVNSNNKEIYNKSEIELEIVGIIKEINVVDDNSYFYCDNGLIDYILQINSNSKIVREQIDSDYNVLGIGMDRDYLLSYLGYESLPIGINIYVSNLVDKEIVIDKLDKYNDSNDKIIYVDTMREAINILKNIINVITFILVVFSMISILVSSLMIFILTNNRVMESIKEIGILGSLGARRKDITRLFNIENLIIGIISSVIGIMVVIFLVNPINYLMKIFLDSDGEFRIYGNLVIIGLIFNIFVVVLSGYIPALIASKRKIIDCVNSRF